MSRIVAPKERQCLQCGRRDEWDDADGVWRIAVDDDGTRQAGSPACIHEWDVTGSFNPINGDHPTE